FAGRTVQIEARPQLRGTDARRGRHLLFVELRLPRLELLFVHGVDVRRRRVRIRPPDQTRRAAELAPHSFHEYGGDALRATGGDDDGIAGQQRRRTADRLVGDGGQLLREPASADAADFRRSGAGARAGDLAGDR